MPLTLHGIGTAVPTQRLSQAEAVEVAHRINAESPDQAKLMARIYQKTKVLNRGSVLLGNDADHATSQKRLSFYGPDSPGTAERMQAFDDHAGWLALEAVREALDDSGLPPSTITHLVTVSCTGFQSPGVDLFLMDKLGLSAAVQRTHIGFMGCHGALNGLRVAHAYAEMDPNAVVLLCAVELCSLHMSYGWHPEQVVANALFADGAAAVVGSAGPPSSDRNLVLQSSGSMVIPDSADLMHWEIGDHGFSMGLSPLVPETVGSVLQPWLQDWLQNRAVDLSEIRSWAVHPGGPRILSTCAEALALDTKLLEESRVVLQDHGNMSSATILFILERLRQRSVAGPCLALAFGPGLSAEVALLDLHHAA
ncbi:type III polyketide synthase [Synechococcus sp. UW179A]|uniref:type III polyketide synthase n=1 Tax=Synechococcus sp. UW179A TaxID=2575510 RepID=UPI000E0FB9A5|nr:type III polyketide synthase [Synechococcus sp. UW179A]